MFLALGKLHKLVKFLTEDQGKAILSNFLCMHETTFPQLTPPWRETTDRCITNSSSAIAHDKDFREVQDWAVAPSSSLKPNEILEDLKERVRYMMNGWKPHAVFKRHSPTKKSRHDNPAERQEDDYIQKHFRSICVSEAYKDKLKGRVVCVFDDFLANGQTFEALRNLLVSCKVKKIILVSIGKFRRRSEFSYIQRYHSIEGNLYSAYYQATLVKCEGRPFEINDDARRSLADLRELACHLCLYWKVTPNILKWFSMCCPKTQRKVILSI